MQIVPTKNVSVIGQLQDVSTTEYTTDINPTDWESANVPGIGFDLVFPPVQNDFGDSAPIKHGLDLSAYLPTVIQLSWHASQIAILAL